jgi:SAM-dependent methyltransferase
LPGGNPLPEDDGIFTFAAGDACNLAEFRNNSFHIAHSNSVIEHVGNWQHVLDFANELQRVAKVFYLQTPNFWFPIEPHFVCPFLHWLPKALRIKMIANFNIGPHKKVQNYHAARIKAESYNLLSKRDLRHLFPHAALHKERFFLLTKSLIVTNKG